MKTPALFFRTIASVGKIKLSDISGKRFYGQWKPSVRMYGWLPYIWRFWMHFNWLKPRSERRISFNLVSRENIFEMISEIIWALTLHLNFWMEAIKVRGMCAASASTDFHRTDFTSQIASRFTLNWSRNWHIAPRSIISCAKIDDGKEAKIILWFAFVPFRNTQYIRYCSLGKRH